MKKRKKITIGLTGGFCSGKSTVRELFKAFGAKTLDCDKVAHESLKKNSATYKKIIRTFGRNILKKSGQVDRKKLGEIVFKNKKQRKKLEGIVHPFVFKRVQEFLKKSKGLLVVEIPLLFESKSKYSFDATLVVSCSQSDVMKRAKKKFPSLSRGQVLDRIRSQMPLQKKKKKADLVIENKRPKEVVKQVGALVSFFKSELG